MHRIAQITDMHLGHRWEKDLIINTRKNLLATIEDARARSVDEIIMTGDLAEEAEISWLLETIGELKIPVSYIFGNHDEKSKYPLWHGEKKTYYQRLIMNTQSLFLDSGNGIVDEEQLGWVEQQISIVDGDLLVFIHHPILDCQTLFMDTKYPLRNREEVANIFKKRGRKTHIFCGHYHMQDERFDANIRQFVTPSTFYQIRADKEDLQQDMLPFGYRIIEIGESIETTVIRLT